MNLTPLFDKINETSAAHLLELQLIADIACGGKPIEASPETAIAKDEPPKLGVWHDIKRGVCAGKRVLAGYYTVSFLGSDAKMTPCLSVWENSGCCYVIPFEDFD